MNQAHIAIALLFALAASACGRNDQPTNTARAQYTDDLGRTVTLTSPVTRIVTLAPNLTEIVFAAGADRHLVGVTTADSYPPEVDSISRVAALPVDFEAIMQLRPSIVLATDQVNSPADAATFESLGIPVYYFRFSEIADIFDAVERTAELAGTIDRGKMHAATLRQALTDLKTRTEPVDAPRVLFLIGPDKLFGFGRGSYVHELIEAAGGVSVSSAEPVAAPIFSDEYVIEQKPEIIFGAFADSVDAKTLLRLHPAWSTVPAIRDNRVYTIDPDLILRPGPRVIEGAYRFALAMHPQIFGTEASSQPQRR